MNKKYIILLVMLCILASSNSYSQTTDFGTRIGLQVENEIKDDLTIFAGEEVRMKENSGILEGLYSELGVEYSPWKAIKMGTSYEFIYYNDYENDDYQPRHRFSLFVQGKQKLNRFTVSLRERIQTTLKDESERDYKMNPKNSWRNRFKVEYNIKKSPLTPSLSLETYYQLNNPDGNKFDKIRYKLELGYKINKHNRIEIYGLLDKEQNVKNPVHQYVIGTQYQYSFK